MNLSFRKWFWALSLLLTSTLLMEMVYISTLVDTFYHVTSVLTSKQEVRSPNQSAGTGDNKTIVVHVYNYFAGFFPRDPFSSCKDKCVLTSGIDHYMDKDVVIFVGHQLTTADPPPKPQGQVWIFFSQEPPYMHRLSLAGWNDVINWTMTYRRDSDILTTYGAFKVSTYGRNDSTQIIVRTGKSRAYMATSNCFDASKRLKYANEMQSYFDVDIYGRCGNFVCPRTMTCERMFSSKYDFYLAFESAMCRDYVTEKSFKLYQHGSNIVPAVRGTNYLYPYFLPPNSYINTEEFPTPANVAHFMEMVSRNRTLYNSYFNWRHNYRYENDNLGQAFCELCSRLHEPTYNMTYHRLYGDLRSWWYGNDVIDICQSVSYTWGFWIKYSLYGIVIIVIMSVCMCIYLRNRLKG